MADQASTLVGRREELAALERTLGDVENGEALPVGIIGEPGIGKSRLLAELARRARERELLVLGGRASELERDVPFAMLGDALEPLEGAELSRLADALHPGELGELAAVLPALASLPEAGAATGERHRVARAFRALVERLAADRPTVMLFDDVHWADPASADALALLLHRPPRGRVLLALAARGGRAPALGAALLQAVRNGGGMLFELGPLPQEAATALLAGMGSAARERLYRESGGNPLYLEALRRVHADARPEQAPAGLAGVPRTVMAALAGELSELATLHRALIEGAAVAGDPFDPAMAAAAAGLGEAEGLAALDVLVAADLVRPTDQPRRFRFRHPLVRRAVYEGSGAGWKIAAHSRAAEALKERGAGAAERAHHVERAAQAGDFAAIELLAEAAEQATTAAPDTSAGWYEAAQRLLPEGAEHDRRRRELLHARGLALASAGRATEARDALTRVLAMLPAGAAAERVEVVLMLAALEAQWLQRPREARRLLEDQRAALGEASPGLTATLTLAMAYVSAEQAEHAETLRLADESATIARAVGDPVLEASALAEAADAAHCLLREDDPEALAAVTERISAAAAVVAALSDDQVAGALQMLMSLSIAQLTTGDLSAARSTVDRGLALARRTRQGLLAPGFVSLRGYIEWELGRLDAAEADQEEALESSLLSGNVQVAYWASVVSSWIALARGKVEAALAHGQKAWDLIGASVYSQAGFTVADARLAAGKPDEAVAALEAFGWVRAQMWTIDRVKAVEVTVRVLLALDRVDEAADWAARAAAEAGGRRTGPFAGMRAHAEAAVLLARGPAAGAAQVALDGAVASDEAGVPIWAARCRILAGEGLAACGRAAEARAELRRAAAELEALGAWGYRDAALRALRRLGDRPRVRAPLSAPGDDRLRALTRREREVAELVAEGHTNAQIAARLHLSERTVEKHVSSVLGKLGLSSRTGVVRLLS